MASHWHILRDGAVVIVTRQLPPRFDVMAQTELPDAGRLKIAQQVRQDMWRLLQKLRGFSPVVSVERHAAGLTVRAGGRAMHPFHRTTLEAQLAELLAEPERRARWLRHAKLKEALK
ncbi:hypothetical protein [Actibacterium sp. 188UL27-1]|uniref:hypothetical protein n=1 Tax=Actibacterium sp. 188UL27-1 TaxID=2786961 RepID=UPI001957CB05|nr:hypothetical protein [Actibacterium sp. 188UL27-1]MBM7069568.1 hypothetical protein [Actibacterium sp. 188UL27-1]